MRILPILAAGIIAVALISIGAAGAWWYAQQGSQTSLATSDSASGEPDATASPPTAGAKSVTNRTGASRIELDMLRQLLALVDAPRREKIVSSADVFAQFIEQERASQAVLTAAYANSADRNDAVETLMLRASQKVLAQAYLTQVVRRNLDTGFPNVEQTQAFYDANPDAFKLPNRVHLWQVFIPAGAQSSAQALKNAEALSKQVAANLQKGTTDFAAAAAKYSKHLQSRVNDGYMGLLKTDDLLPAVREAVAALKSDQISAPVKSAAGFHILKRGALVEGTQLAFSEVQGRVIEQLRREAENRVQQAALKKILETYPVTVDESAIERWRQALQSNAPPSNEENVSPPPS